MKEQLKKQSLSDRGIGLGRYNRLIENYNAQNFVFDRNYFTMIQTPGGWVVSLAGRNNSSSRINEAWGYTISANVITISKGLFVVDGRGQYESVSTPLTITGGTEASPHKIIMQSPRSSPAATVVYRASPADPSGSAYYEFTLYDVGLEDGQAKVYYTWHRGSNIIVGASI